MRLLFPLLSLITAATAIVVSRVQPDADHPVCRYGGCRYEQLMNTMEERGASPAALAALLQEDSSNPLMWSSYGEYLAERGDIEQAALAFQQAEATGGGLAPVLTRVANFAFTHDQRAMGLRVTPRILEQTAEYDEILFSYLEMPGADTLGLLGSAVPATPRPARAWLAWMRDHADPKDVVMTWQWMQRANLTDEKSAVDTVRVLWANKAYDDAQTVWTAYAGSDGNTPGNLLANDRFERAPKDIPFDWDLSARPGVGYVRKDGLAVTFDGTQNLTDAGVGQQALVTPGSYLFRAEVSAASLSTDQGLFFQIADADNATRLTAQTTPVIGTADRTPLELLVRVPAETRVLRIRLLRTASLRFDSKLSGTLQVHHVELVPVVDPVPAVASTSKHRS
jgi:hypothetical protein